MGRAGWQRALGFEPGGAVPGDLEHHPSGAAPPADLQLSLAPAPGTGSGAGRGRASGSRARALSLALREASPAGKPAPAPVGAVVAGPAKLAARRDPDWLSSSRAETSILSVEAPISV